MNKYATGLLKSKNVDGINVSFGVNYVFDKDKKADDLKEGENLLTFDKSPEDNDHISEVEAHRSIDEEDGSVQSFSGNTGTVYGSGNNNSVVLHESLHLLGLSDRYDEYDNNPLTGTKRDTEPQKGFEHDIMSNLEHKLNQYYYEQYAKIGKTFSKIFYSDVIPMNSTIDRDSKGNLLTPYEPKGIHLNQNADR